MHKKAHYSLIPRESPKGNHFRSRELITFLKIDYTNINWIVLLIFTFHAAGLPHCHSVQNSSIGYQEVIYPEGV